MAGEAKHRQMECPNCNATLTLQEILILKLLHGNMSEQRAALHSLSGEWEREKRTGQWVLNWHGGVFMIRLAKMKGQNRRRESDRI